MLTDRDWLTGLYNRIATEEKVNQLLRREKMGVLLLADVDHFRQFNDRFGHAAGDRLLRQLVELLRSMVFRSDILGRVGGDEFVIYMAVRQGIEFAQERGRQIRARIRNLQPDGASHLSVSIGGSVYAPGDDYRSLYGRAAQGLARPERCASPEGGALDVDLKLTRAELTEQELVPGAYCSDYETFKSIYRFIERRLRRTQSSVYAVLVTLTDGSGDFPSFSARARQMETLKEVIQSSLRLGDVFTRYSSCQYLLLVCDVVEQDVARIVGRIREATYQQLPECPAELLLHSCYPLRPVGD